MTRLLKLFAALGVLAACSGGGGGGDGSGGGGGPTGWTILVYAAADNNLEDAALLNLRQMAVVGSSPGLNIVAEVDRAPSGMYTPPGTGLLNLPAWTTAKRLLVKQGAFQEMADLGEINTADPANLADFIRWSVKTYPAAHYMLVLWDHGGGWQGFGVDETVPGSTSSDTMGVLRIQAGVQNGLAAAGLAKFDVIGFDACLMASFEVAEALKSSASYLVASEELEPGHGWDYRILAGSAAADPLTLSKKIADGYQAIANSTPYNDGAGITLSVLDLSKLGPIEAGLAKVTADYGTVATVGPILTSVGQGRAAAMEFGKSPQPANSYNLVDMGDLFAHLSVMGADATALQTAVQGAVAYKVNGSTFAKATGLTIYFPPQAAYYVGATYDPLPGTAGWRTFLSAYYGGAGAAAVPTFASATFNATATGVALDGILTAGSLAGVTRAELLYGIPGTAGDAWVYGDQPAQTSTNVSGDHVTSTWDYSFLRLSQTVPAAHAEYGYMSVRQVDASTGLVIIPMSYYPPTSTVAQSAFREIAFTIATGAILSDGYFVESAGLVGQLTPATGSTMHARVAHLATAGTFSGSWVDYTSVGAFDARSPIGIQFPVLGTGASYFAGLRVENANGAGDWIASPWPPLR